MGKACKEPFGFQPRLLPATGRPSRRVLRVATQEQRVHLCIGSSTSVENVKDSWDLGGGGSQALPE